MNLTRKRWVVGLSVAGLLPFAGFALTALEGSAWALRAFLIYSLAISAFLSGAWWGIALSKTSFERTPVLPLLLSNGFVLMSVGALVCYEPEVALLTQAVVITLLVLGESQINPLRAAPRYYQRMRRGVSAGVVLLHLALWSLL